MKQKLREANEQITLLKREAEASAGATVDLQRLLLHMLYFLFPSVGTIPTQWIRPTEDHAVTFLLTCH